MPNEWKTEQLVQDLFQSKGYYEDEEMKIEGKKSEIESIKNLLSKSSKQGTKAHGSPEYIITNKSDYEFVAIVECKYDIKNHRSKKLDRPVKYALDGALHYASFLAPMYNVFAIAVSGVSETECKVSTWFHSKGEETPRELQDENGKPIEALLPWKSLIHLANFNPKFKQARLEELIDFSRELHELMREHAKLAENEKPLLVSGILIAFRDKAFSKNFQSYSKEDLQREFIQSIERELTAAKIPDAKIGNMIQPYRNFEGNPELDRETKKFPAGILREIMDRLFKKVWPIITYYEDFDAVGQFYGEFLKYTGGDKKSLGIVLTPKHVTELFVELANVHKKTKVLDICAGTGGFLISAMSKMIYDAKSDQKQIKNIKANGLVGVESQRTMFALAASNMILRGDGRTNLYQRDCFEKEMLGVLKEHKCDVGFLNPPYSQKDPDLHELVYVNRMLDCLIDGGVGIAIVPISCATSPSLHKHKLMKNHTLQGVLSMPLELFNPVATVTCVMVWKAGTPHATANLKSWFGYCREDGFVKTKYNGRIDKNGKWSKICENWVTKFRNREESPGFSIMKQVGPDDEWVAEAYLETDYSNIFPEEFQEYLKDYAVFKLKSGIL